MNHTTQTPFPTLMELVRYILNAFDIGRKIKKEVDNKTSDKYVSLPQALQYFYEPAVIEDLRWVLGSEEGVDQFIYAVENQFKWYMQWLTEFDGNGFRRSEVQHLLLRLISGKILYNQWSFKSNTYPVSILTKESGNVGKALPNLLALLEIESLAWQGLKNAIDENQKEQLLTWKSGEHIPDLQSLKLILNERGLEKERLALCLARAWDWLIRELDGENISPTELSPSHTTKMLEMMLKHHHLEMHKALSLSGHADKLKSKPSDTPDEAESVINDIKASIQGSNNPNLLPIHCDWELAHIRAHQGRFEDSLTLFKQVVDQSIYIGSTDIKEILQDAMMASAAIKRDKAFCKKVKRLQISYGYALPVPTSTPYDPGQVQEWEIDRYAEEFRDKYGIDIPKEPKSESGMLLLSGDGSIRYDFKNPNKVISVPLNRGYKRMPQLVYSVWQSHWKEFNKLLDADADVNQLSSNNESALLIAVEKMAYNSLSCRDDRFFKRLIQYPHTPEALNKLTDKRLSSILTSAITTCDPQVVSEIIKQDIDLDKFATSDACSPLYKAISQTKISLEGFADMSNASPTLMQEAIRRETNGSFGSDLAIQDKVLNDPLMQESMKAVVEKTLKLSSQLNENNCLDIAKLLIDAGANVNLEHNTPIKGYTPLMLAVELGLSDLVEAMLESGGDPYQCYFNSKLQGHVDSFEIAKVWGQQQTLKVLKTYSEKQPINEHIFKERSSIN
ncbi:hypothetical protein A3759_06155 [Thalassolituus sp. HI0120]|nr:hypothetical protein A3759_06155 [Thalassolituus sp. HI0120]